MAGGYDSTCIMVQYGVEGRPDASVRLHFPKLPEFHL